MAHEDNIVDTMITRQRQEKKDKLYVRIDGNSVVVGNKIRLSVNQGKNIIILEDEFKSSYDCTGCKGTGEIEGKCIRCNGTGFELQSADPANPNVCGRCGATGKLVRECSICKGKGALIELPDQAKSRPTSGIIQCIGPDVTFYKQRDKVAYSGYTGHLIPFKGNTRLRIMLESEPFCLVEDLEGELIGEPIEFVDKDTAYDLT